MKTLIEIEFQNFPLQQVPRNSSRSFSRFEWRVKWDFFRDSNLLRMFCDFSRISNVLTVNLIAIRDLMTKANTKWFARFVILIRCCCLSRRCMSKRFLLLTFFIGIDSEWRQRAKGRQNVFLLCKSQVEFICAFDPSTIVNCWRICIKDTLKVFREFPPKFGIEGSAKYDDNPMELWPVMMKQFESWSQQCSGDRERHLWASCHMRVKMTTIFGSWWNEQQFRVQQKLFYVFTWLGGLFVHIGFQVAIWFQQKSSHELQLCIIKRWNWIRIKSCIKFASLTSFVSTALIDSNYDAKWVQV